MCFECSRTIFGPPRRIARKSVVRRTLELPTKQRNKTGGPALEKKKRMILTWGGVVEAEAGLMFQADPVSKARVQSSVSDMARAERRGSAESLRESHVRVVLPSIVVDCRLYRAAGE